MIRIIKVDGKRYPYITNLSKVSPSFLIKKGKVSKDLMEYEEPFWGELVQPTKELIHQYEQMCKNL